MKRMSEFENSRLNMKQMAALCGGDGKTTNTTTSSTYDSQGNKCDTATTTCEDRTSTVVVKDSNGKEYKKEVSSIVPGSCSTITK